MSDVYALYSPFDHVDQEEKVDTPVVGPLPDERPDSGVQLDPALAATLNLRLVGGVVGDEVGSVVVSIDGEQPGSGEPVTEGAAFEIAVHDVDEEADDVSTVVGLVSDEGGYGHGWVAVDYENICSDSEYRGMGEVRSRGL